jgi:hypothetical protein
MKILSYFIIVFICFSSCKQSVKPDHHYRVIIIRDAFNFEKPGYHKENKEDFFQAKNDTMAFDSAAKAFYLNLISEKNTHNKVSISRSFKVLNFAGTNLETMLSKKTRDSINLKYSRLIISPKLKFL